jgi:L-2-hydroxyglutarate oxidase LhgO
MTQNLDAIIIGAGVMGASTPAKTRTLKGVK